MSYEGEGTLNDVSTAQGSGSSSKFSPALNFETGTWTPGFTIGGSSTGITFAATPTGTYTRIGNIVFFRFTFTLSSKGSNTGNTQITNFPIAFNSNSGSTGIAITQFNAITLANTYDNIALQPQTGTSNAYLFQSSSSGLTTGTINDPQLANNTNMNGSGFYFI